MTSKRQLEEFIDRFAPEIAAVARDAFRHLRAIVPTAVVLVYDNYNALVIGFASTERATGVIVSLAVYPRWVSLFFMQGAKLRDPGKVLQGSGKRVRHIVLRGASDLELPAVRELIGQAITLARPKLGDDPSRAIVIKSVSAKQRPRRPKQVVKS